MVIERYFKRNITCGTIWLCALATGLMFSASSHAGVISQPAEALTRFKITNNSGQDATDFHLEVFSTDPKELLTFNSSSASSCKNLPRSGRGVGSLAFDFSGCNIERGADASFGIFIKQRKNEVRVKKAFWTPIGEANGSVSVLGFSVVGDPIYTIFNDFDTAIGISGLGFLVDVPEIDNLLLLPGTLTGLTFIQSDFVLAANSSLVFNVPGIVSPGNYMYAQGDMFDPVSGTSYGSFIHGHEQPVPEPSVAALLAIGLVGIGFSKSRRLV